MTVYFNNNGEFSCRFSVKWGGGETQQTGTVNAGGSAQIDLSSYPDIPSSASCWAKAYIDDGVDHESGDNFAYGTSNVTYTISGGSQTPSFSCNGC